MKYYVANQQLCEIEKSSKSEAAGEKRTREREKENGRASQSERERQFLYVCNCMCARKKMEERVTVNEKDSARLCVQERKCKSEKDSACVYVCRKENRRASEEERDGTFAMRGTQTQFDIDAGMHVRLTYPGTWRNR
ncbi:hypothetical protein KM043_002481 [Ampulex compressa]|nr:hypothetical protein KM043_002481 [Ampulex compressa]